ncbi:hypothetical protein RCG17_27380 [Neobacillus sp. PS3-12]|uniref:hypothetical protein n=1 Tax=Neobacillus sp. PS3-12 TaxID=3070677 RepID=UPI0027DFC159|nr:hypothetical protein [Neobacillus sp. PS3-12]WML53019.1 hypothetical protein RCG17_27380 [Neobacillus sp. PS3-12]
MHNNYNLLLNCSILPLFHIVSAVLNGKLLLELDLRLRLEELDLLELLDLRERLDLLRRELLAWLRLEKRVERLERLLRLLDLCLEL